MRQKSGFSRVRKPHRSGRGGGVGGLDSFIQSHLHHRAISVKNFLLNSWYLVLDIVMV
jgi:hypothetical protein